MLYALCWMNACPINSERVWAHECQCERQMQGLLSAVNSRLCSIIWRFFMSSAVSRSQSPRCLVFPSDLTDLWMTVSLVECLSLFSAAIQLQSICWFASDTNISDSLVLEDCYSPTVGLTYQCSNTSAIWIL